MISLVIVRLYRVPQVGAGRHYIGVQTHEMLGLSVILSGVPTSHTSPHVKLQHEPKFNLFREDLFQVLLAPGVKVGLPEL